MAEILDNRIVCDKTDPRLNTRIPVSLLYWVDEAATYRGISTEELVNETLFYFFGRKPNTKGEYEVFNDLEKARRAKLLYTRWNRMYDERRKKVEAESKARTITPPEVMASIKRIDWASYTRLREANLARIELKAFRIEGIGTTKRTPEELEAIRAQLEAKGIKQNTIRLENGTKVWVRSRSAKKAGLVKCKPVNPGNSDLQKAVKGKKGFITDKAAVKAERAANAKLLAQAPGTDGRKVRGSTLQKSIAKAEALGISREEIDSLLGR